VRKLGPDYTPFEALGGPASGEAKIRAIVEDFYDAMEPALAKLHKCDEEGRVDRESRDRFALFLIGWLGGPQHYMERHGHPRLRMRHGKVPVNSSMRDAWMRAMRVALDKQKVEGDVRRFVEEKLAEVADFLRNQPG
jgi:hemoglobin